MEIGNEPDIMTLKQAAQFLQITERYLQELIHAGTIPAVKLGKGWRIMKADIPDALRELAVKNQKPEGE